LKKVASRVHFFLQITSVFVISLNRKVPNSGDLKIRRNMKKEEIKDTIEDGVCSDENKDKKRKKKPWERSYKDPPFYDEFTPFWGPGSKYKPWIYGK